MSWRAIFAGLLIAFGVQILLTLLGVAVGLSAFEPASGVMKGVGIGLGVWMIITAVASVFAGAYFGSRIAGDPWRGDGMAHGIVVWAGFLVLSLWLVGSSLGGAVGSAAGLARHAASVVSNPDQAVNALIALGYDRAQAESIVGQMRPAQPTIRPDDPEVRARAREAADKAAAAGAVATWVSFGIALLSLLGGALGGVLGSVGEEKAVVRTAHAEGLVHPASVPPSQMPMP